MNIIKITIDNITYKCRIEKATYAVNDNLALRLVDIKTKVFVLSLTVKLPGYFLERDTSFVDTNNSPESIKIIKKYKLGEQVYNGKFPIIGMSGFCTYPLYKFDLERIKQYE